MIDIEAIYAEHAARIRAYLRRRVGDPDLADDLSQEVWLRVQRSVERFEARNDHYTSAWLTRIARNLLVDHYKQRRLTVVSLDETWGRAVVDAGAAHHADRLDLRAALERLTPPQRAVLVERYLHGRSHRQTAAVVGAGVENVRKLQWRALARLRARLTALEAAS